MPQRREGGKENGREGSQHTNGGGEEGRRCECVCAGKKKEKKGHHLAHCAVRDSTRDWFFFLVIIDLGINVGMLLI